MKIEHSHMQDIEVSLRSLICDINFYIVTMRLAKRAFSDMLL